MALNWIDPKIVSRIAHLVSEPDYSLDVHAGRERTDGTRMPARPFMDAAVVETDLEKTLAQNYLESGDIDDAFNETARALHEGIKEQIASPKWQWDRTTIRSDGSAVSSPRDAIDTGKLYEGQKLYLDSDD
jgi:hypothetical protein